MNIISIVTPSFNQGKFIEETIKSVLQQKGNFYIDYIIQDSASKDESIKIIKKYEDMLKKNCRTKKYKGLNFYVKKNKKFKFNKCSGISYRWVSKKDKGQVDGIKKGFTKSKGNILNWLNSDDIFVGSKVFSKIISYFEKDKQLKIISADGIQINSAGNKIGVIRVPFLNLKENLFLDYHVLQPSTFIKREIYRNGYLKDKYRVAFDAEFFIHLLIDGNKYKKTDDIFSAYRFYPEIKTLSLSKIRYWDQFFIAITYSKNIFYLLISLVYRYFEIILRQKTNNFIFNYFFIKFRKISYLIITGKKDRYE